MRPPHCHPHRASIVGRRAATSRAAELPACPAAARGSRAPNSVDAPAHCQPCPPEGCAPHPPLPAVWRRTSPTGCDSYATLSKRCCLPRRRCQLAEGIKHLLCRSLSRIGIVHQQGSDDRRQRVHLGLKFARNCWWCARIVQRSRHFRRVLHQRDRAAQRSRRFRRVLLHIIFVSVVACLQLFQSVP